MTLLTTAERLHRQGFAVIPVEYKKPKPAGWQTMTGDNRQTPNGNFQQPSVTGIGTVLGTKVGDGYLAALDADCLHPDLSRAYCAHIADVAGGPMPYRVGQAPKFLVPVLLDKPTRKLRSKAYTSPDGDAVVEVLGQGQQFVAYGQHSEGCDYRWYNGDLDIDALPVMTLEQVQGLLRDFDAMAENFGMDEVAAGSTTNADDPGDFMVGAKVAPLEMTRAEVIDLLKSYPAEGLHYDQWLGVGTALHHQYQGEGDGYTLWLKWSERSSKHNAREMRKKWSSFGKGERRELTMATVIKWAKEADTRQLVEPVEDVITPKVEPKPGLFVPITTEFQDADHTIYWTVKPVVEQRSLVNLYGPSGVGKSYLAIDLALCVATGKPWNGGPVHQGKVLYVAGEGHKGLNRRIYGWRSERGFPDTGDLIATTRSINLGEKSDREQMVAYLDSLDGVALVVVDTLGRAIAGKDENSAADVQPILEFLGGLIRRYKCSVILVHHTPKATTADSAGSKNIRASMDVEMALDHVPGGGVGLYCRKMKEGEPFVPMGFKFTQIQLPGNYNDEYGDASRTAVLTRDDTVLTAAASSKLTPSGEAVMAAFDALWEKDDSIKAPTPEDIIRGMGMDAPTEGLWLSDVRDQFDRMHPAQGKKECDVRRRKWARGVDDTTAKDALILLDEVLVKP